MKLLKKDVARKVKSKYFKPVLYAAEVYDAEKGEHVRGEWTTNADANRQVMEAKRTWSVKDQDHTANGTVTGAWTREENEVLERLYRTDTSENIAEKLNRKSKDVRNQMRHLGIYIEYCKRFNC